MSSRQAFMQNKKKQKAAIESAKILPEQKAPLQKKLIHKMTLEDFASHMDFVKNLPQVTQQSVPRHP